MQQLMMWWTKQSIPVIALPEGFKMRTYKDGDARGWIEVCKDGLGTGSMTEEDFNRQMLGMEGIRPDGIFFIVNQKDEIAGTATGVLKPNAMGYLHMVSVSPEFRGKGLARPLNAQVLKYLAEHGCENVTLHTDDFRIPAVKVYLGLGFRPVLHDEDMPDRWRKVLKECGYSEVDTFTIDGMPGPVLRAGV